MWFFSFFWSFCICKLNVCSKKASLHDILKHRVYISGLKVIKTCRTKAFCICWRFARTLRLINKDQITWCRYYSTLSKRGSSPFSNCSSLFISKKLIISASKIQKFLERDNKASEKANGLLHSWTCTYIEQHWELINSHIALWIVGSAKTSTLPLLCDPPYCCGCRLCGTEWQWGDLSDGDKWDLLTTHTHTHAHTHKHTHTDKLLDKMI